MDIASSIGNTPLVELKRLNENPKVKKSLQSLKETTPAAL